MPTLKQIGFVAIAAMFALALATDAADARRVGGGSGGMRTGGGGFSGGGMRAGGGRAGFAGGGPRGPHVSNPIARPGLGNRPGGPGWAGNRPGWGGRPGYGPGYGYRPGYGWGAAAALGAGAAYSAYGSGYGYYDEAPYQSYQSYEAPSGSDAIAECAARFRTYDPASQTYIKSKGVRASCP